MCLKVVCVYFKALQQSTQYKNRPLSLFLLSSFVYLELYGIVPEIR